MIILQETNQAQLVKFIPTREGGLPSTLKLRNETTNVQTTQVVTSSFVSFYCQFSAVMSLKQGHFYTMELFSGDTLIHRDKVFCTNQNVSTYSVNQGEYVPSGGNIIFYE